MCDNIKYCFLNVVYFDTNNEDQIYELVLSDSMFQNISIYRTNLQELKKFIDGKEWVFDFAFVEGYLKCDSCIKRIQLNNLIQCGWIEEKSSNLTLYDLLIEGIQNHFLFLEECVVNSEEWEGLAITRFSALKFSQSTMSIYYRVVTENGIFNKMLVHMEGSKLIQHGFYFAVPYENKFSQKAEFIKSMRINGKMYSVWKVDVISIYDMNVIISYSLINKANCMRARLSNLYETLADYLDLAYSLDIDVPERKQWIGSSKSYASPYGVWFKSSVTKIKASRRLELIKIAARLLGEGMSKDDAIKLCHKSVKSREERYVLHNLLRIVYGEDPLNFVVNYKEYVACLILFADIYLYKIRSRCFLEEKRILQKMGTQDSRLTGSDEFGFTIIEEGFAYGF